MFVVAMGIMLQEQMSWNKQNDYLRTQRFGVTVVSSYDPGIAHAPHVSPLLHSAHKLRHAK